MEVTLRVVKTVLDHAPGVKGYTLIGAMAMGAWVVPRKTMDLDILVHVQKRSQRIVDHISSRLAARGWSVATYRHEHPSILSRIRSQTPKGFMVDLIFVHSSLHRKIVESSKTVPIGKRFRFPVATPEGIVLLKLIAGRRQDWMDVERLLAEAELDEDLLFRLARKTKLEQDLIKVARRAGWNI